MSTYPEHDKLKQVMGCSQELGEFLEWLQENGYVLARWRQRHIRMEHELVPCGESIEKILAKRFNIDLKVLEDEKRQIIEELKSKCH